MCLIWGAAPAPSFQARLSRSFSGLSTLGHLASFSYMVGERPRFSGVMDLPAAAFLHKWGDLHLIAPPWGLMVLFLGGFQVKADRKRLISGLFFSPSPLLPLLGATTLLGQLTLHSLPGCSLQSLQIHTHSSLTALDLLPGAGGSLKLRPPSFDSGPLRT